MKYACLALFVVVLLLFGFAGFQVLTVPKRDVEAARADLMKKIEASEKKQADWDKALKDAAEQAATEGGDAATGTDGAAKRPGAAGDRKNIELNEKNLETYDDTATKEEGMDEAKDKIGTLFKKKE